MQFTSLNLTRTAMPGLRAAAVLNFAVRMERIIFFYRILSLFTFIDIL